MPNIKKIAQGKKINVAINGFGRIGRTTFKALLQSPRVRVVGINDLVDTGTLAHLLQYDSVYGKYPRRCQGIKDNLVVDGITFPVCAIKEPGELPWAKLGVDVVLECTGRFTDRESALLHLAAGAKKVIISAPAKSDDVKTIVLGVNEKDLQKSDKIISMASCTTNCLAPITAVICQTFGVKKAIMSTVHAYTADQSLVDGPHKDLRRARAAAINIIPTTTGAAISVTKTIPELADKFDGMALRVPVSCGSITDATYLTNKTVTAAQVNDALAKASRQAPFKGIIAVSSEPLVSTDIVGNPASAIVDLGLTKVIDGDLLKVVAWYDNECGYSNRLAEMAEFLGKINF